MSSRVEQLQHGLAEDPVDPEDQRRHDDDGDEHDQRVVDRLGPGGPRHLAELAAHLVHALAAEEAALLDLGLGGTGGGATALLANRLAVSVDIALTLEHPLLFSVHGHDVTHLQGYREGQGVLRWAGHEGLEPPTPGFGDRCSTN